MEPPGRTKRLSLLGFRTPGLPGWVGVTSGHLVALDAPELPQDSETEQRGDWDPDKMSRPGRGAPRDGVCGQEGALWS